MSNTTSNILREEERGYCHRSAQTDRVFLMTEVEQTMLYFIRIFKINIAKLSSLCNGVVYNYSSQRYTVDTEPIQTDSEDDEPSQTMKATEETAVNKLIDNEISSTTTVEKTQKSASIGINTDLRVASDLDVVEVRRTVPNETVKLTDEVTIEHLNSRPEEPTDRRNIILNKWIKDNQCREQSINNTEQLNQIRQSQSLGKDPIPLVKKVSQPPEICDQRPKSVSNPKPGSEYVSPYVKASYPLLVHNDLPLLIENHVPLVHSKGYTSEEEITKMLTAANSRISEMEQKLLKQQNLHHQQMLEQQSKKEMRINYLCQHIDALQKQVQEWQQTQLLPATSPLHSSTVRPPQVNLLQQSQPPLAVSVSSEMPAPITEAIQSPTYDGSRSCQINGHGVFPIYNNTPANVQQGPPRQILPQPTMHEESVNARRKYKRNTLRQARVNHTRPSLPDCKIPECGGVSGSAMWPHDQRWPYAYGLQGTQNIPMMHAPPEMQQNTASFMHGMQGMPNTAGMMHAPSGMNNSLAYTAQHNVPSARGQGGTLVQGNQSNVNRNPDSYVAHGLQRNQNNVHLTHDVQEARFPKVAPDKNNQRRRTEADFYNPNLAHNMMH